MDVTFIEMAIGTPSRPMNRMHSIRLVALSQIDT